MYRPDAGIWYVLLSGTNYTSYVAYQWGISTDIPIPADYDGDGKTDAAVYRPPAALVCVHSSQRDHLRQVSMGRQHDIPVPADYDGDDEADIGFPPSNGRWYPDVREQLHAV